MRKIIPVCCLIASSQYEGEWIIEERTYINARLLRKVWMMRVDTYSMHVWRCYHILLCKKYYNLLWAMIRMKKGWYNASRTVPYVFLIVSHNHKGNLNRALLSRYSISSEGVKPECILKGDRYRDKFGCIYFFSTLQLYIEDTKNFYKIKNCQCAWKQINQCIVIPRLTYSCQRWTYVKLVHNIEVCQRKMERKPLGIRLIEKSVIRID